MFKTEYLNEQSDDFLNGVITICSLIDKKRNLFPNRLNELIKAVSNQLPQDGRNGLEMVVKTVRMLLEKNVSNRDIMHMVIKTIKDCQAISTERRLKKRW
jgi:hypothetical protein